MNNAGRETSKRVCDDATAETESPECLAETLVELCAQVSAQDQRRGDLVATLREGAERALALEADIQQNAGARDA